MIAAPISAASALLLFPALLALPDALGLTTRRAPPPSAGEAGGDGFALEMGTVNRERDDGERDGLLGAAA